MNGPDRTVARKSSIEGIYVWAGGLDILKIDKNSLIYGVSYFNLGDWSFVWEAKPTIAPHGEETGFRAT